MKSIKSTRKPPQIAHTSTPWYAGTGKHSGEICATDGEGEVYAIANCELYNYLNGDPEAKANRAFILRAVNAHDELVEAAQELLDNLDDADETKDDSGKEFKDIAALRAALTKAQGGKV